MLTNLMPTTGSNKDKWLGVFSDSYECYSHMLSLSMTTRLTAQDISTLWYKVKSIMP